MTTFTKNKGGRGGSSRESHLPRKGYQQDALFAFSKSHQELSRVNSSRESHGDQELSRVNKDGTAHFGGHSLGIYIQVPFCQTKCTYCNFHTGVASPSAYAPYARAVEREITNWRTFHSAAGIASAAGPALGCHPEFGGPPVVIPNPGRIL